MFGKPLTLSGGTKLAVRVRGRQDSGLCDVPDREMTAGTDAGVTPDSHARPVLSVDTRDALGVEYRRVALVGSAGHVPPGRVTADHVSPAIAC